MRTSSMEPFTKADGADGLDTASTPTVNGTVHVKFGVFELADPRVWATPFTYIVVFELIGPGVLVTVMSVHWFVLITLPEVGTGLIP